MSVHRSISQTWVVDDSSDVRFFFERAFKRLGRSGSVNFFTDGTEFLDHVRAGHALPNVIILDMQMPKIDGLTALNTLCREKGIGETAVLICSSNEQPEAVKNAYSAGARLFIRKPLTADEYLQLATLCSESASEIRKLPSSDGPFGVVDVERAADLIRASKCLEKE